MEPVEGSKENTLDSPRDSRQFTAIPRTLRTLRGIHGNPLGHFGLSEGFTAIPIDTSDSPRDSRQSPRTLRTLRGIHGNPLGHFGLSEGFAQLILINILEACGFCETDFTSNVS